MNLLHKMILFWKRLEILYWWHFIIKRNEFHPSLDYLNGPDVLIRREIAHLLDKGYSIWDIPDYYIEKF